MSSVKDLLKEQRLCCRSLELLLELRKSEPTTDQAWERKDPYEKLKDVIWNDFNERHKELMKTGQVETTEYMLKNYYGVVEGVYDQLTIVDSNLSIRRFFGNVSSIAEDTPHPSSAPLVPAVLCSVVGEQLDHLEPGYQHKESVPLSPVARSSISPCQKSRWRCGLCSGNHLLHQCRSFHEKALEDRIAFVRSNNLCILCLRRHSVKSCKFTWNCRICSGRHNTKLHRKCQPLPKVGEAALNKVSGAVVLPVQPGHQKVDSVSSSPSARPQFCRSEQSHCDMCSGSHLLHKCKSFDDKTLEDRVAFIRSNNLCKLCLGRHSVRSCKFTWNCKICTGRHNTKLHCSGQQPAMERIAKSSRTVPRDCEFNDQAFIDQMQMNVSPVSGMERKLMSFNPPCKDGTKGFAKVHFDQLSAFFINLVVWQLAQNLLKFSGGWKLVSMESKRN